MAAARAGIITEEMKAVAAKEYRTEEEIRDLVARGQVAICANKLHKCLDPNGIGSMLRTKINVNLGVSRDCKDYDIEMKKVMAAVDMGAEAIMDLSSHGDTQPFRRKLTAECPAMIGTVPVYDSVIHYQRRRLRYPPLRHHQKDYRPDQKAQAKDEHSIQRRIAGLCLDDHDRRGKSVL